MKRAAILLLILISFGAGAQTIFYSAPEKFDLHTGDYSVLGYCGNRLYTYRSSSDGYFLDVLDDSMHRTATVVLDFFPPKIYETKFIVYSEKIIVLYQANERGRINQYAALLDENGRLQGKIIMLAEAKTSIFGPSGDYFSGTVSDDKKSIAVYSSTVKGSHLHLLRILLDDHLKIIQKQEYSYEGENALTLAPAMLDNQGNFFLPVLTQTGSRNYADGIWILTIMNGSHKLSARELPLNSSFASGLFFKLDNLQGKIYSGGFYSNKKAGNYDGVVYGQLPTDSGAIPKMSALSFDERLRDLSGHSSRRAFNDNQTRQLIIRNDGGFVLLAEDYYTTVRNGGVGPFGYYNYYYSPYLGAQNIREYHYGDITALSYNADGTLQWSSFIRKDQYSQEDGGIFSSYALVNTGGALGLLYNDFDSRRSKITLASLDDQGKTNIESLNTGNGSDADWIPRSGKQISSHELIVPCLRRRQICFAKVVF